MQSQPHNGHANGNGIGLPGLAMNGLPNIAPSYINPAQMSQSIQPDANGSQKKRTVVPNTKRRRTDTPDEPSVQQRKNREGPRKKKANRACFHCQKAHLTCDDCEWAFWALLLLPIDYRLARPCQRCVKRGLADNCTEGHRKKAKYLLDEEELGMCPFFHRNDQSRPITFRRTTKAK